MGVFFFFFPLPFFSTDLFCLLIGSFFCIYYPPPNLFLLFSDPLCCGLQEKVVRPLSSPLFRLFSPTPRFTLSFLTNLHFFNCPLFNLSPLPFLPTRHSRTSHTSFHSFPPALDLTTAITLGAPYIIIFFPTTHLGRPPPIIFPPLFSSTPSQPPCPSPAPGHLFLNLQLLLPLSLSRCPRRVIPLFFLLPCPSFLMLRPFFRAPFRLSRDPTYGPTTRSPFFPSLLLSVSESTHCFSFTYILRPRSSFPQIGYSPPLLPFIRHFAPNHFRYCREYMSPPALISSVFSSTS